jgi:ribonuclease VapC
MFLDASVILAVLLDEPEATEIIEHLETEPLFASGVVKLETLLRMIRRYEGDATAAEEDVEAFFASWDISLIPVDAIVTDQAMACASRYHITTGHPARLNMGDCFAYAAARTRGVKLAYKGDDFVHTDADAVRFGG